jgi:hypothetical protein
MWGAFRFTRSEAWQLPAIDCQNHHGAPCKSTFPSLLTFFRLFSCFRHIAGELQGITVLMDGLKLSTIRAPYRENYRDFEDWKSIFTANNSLPIS